MARTLGKLSLTILSSLKLLTEAVNEYGRSPMGSRYQLARWLWTRTRPIGVPYDTRYRRTVWRLRRAGLIRLQHHRIDLTSEATEHLAVSSTQPDEMTLTRPEVWDGIWRMIVWDIPERKHELRDRFRRKLAELGFVRIQGSIWLTPYPCQREILRLRGACGLGSENVLYVEALYIEGQARLLAHFRLLSADGDQLATAAPPPPLTQADAKLVDRYVQQT